MSGYDITKPGPVKDWMIRQCDARLQSCHKMHVKTVYAWLNRTLELDAAGGVDMMFDSGAFTAWNKGHKTTIDDLLPVYSDLQNKYEDKFKSVVYINLDTIPGSREKAPTEREIEEALIESDKNFEILERELGKGKILPVFHQGEPMDRLKVVSQQSKFICLSARQGLSEQLRINFIQQSVGYLKDNGLENDLHGLATTGNTIIRATDWFSVDSASWAIAAAFGSILVPINGNIFPVAVSEHSPSRFDKDRHFRTFSKAHQEIIIEALEHYGLTPDLVATINDMRRAFNIIALRDWAIQLSKEKRKIRTEQGLFDYF